MNEKFVYAVYETIEEAKQAVSNLTGAGIPLSAITLYADDDVIEEAHNVQLDVDIKELDDDHHHRSIWNRIADFFSMDEEEESYPVDFSGYQDEIDDDKILVVVDKSFEGDALAVNTTVDVLDETNPNSVETFVHEDFSDHQEDVIEENDFVAGDMGAAIAVSEEYTGQTEPGVQPEQPVVDSIEEKELTNKTTSTEGESVIGDFSAESEMAEAYYTNIDAQRVEKKNDEPTDSAQDVLSDEELRERREEHGVAGDMGDYSDYAEYHQNSQSKPASDDTQAKEADSANEVPHHELGEFEKEMRRHESNPPADEVGVNPEQFDNSDQ
ncbi:hypothetical protein ACF3NG_02375 [Aerococcaceae bacterium WGS1372]